jgi:signal peptidase I
MTRGNTVQIHEAPRPPARTEPAATDQPDGEPRSPDGARSSRTVRVLIVVAVLVLVGRWLVVEPFRVGSGSMAPTLKAGNHVLVDKLIFRLGGDPERRQLVVFSNPQTGETMLKRVVGVGGDSVGLRNGVLFVNGRRLDEPFYDPVRLAPVWYGPVRVPAGHIFVMGDNRANSVDSRDFGPVPRDRVIGRVAVRFP